MSQITAAGIERETQEEVSVAWAPVEASKQQLAQSLEQLKLCKKKEKQVNSTHRPALWGKQSG